MAAPQNPPPVTPPAATPVPANAPDDNHEVVGWDAAPQGKDVPWHPVPAAPPRRRWKRRALWIMVVLVSLAILIATYQQWGQSGSTIAQNEMGFRYMAKAISTAQSQYVKKYDRYATSARQLYQANGLLPLHMANAFEDWQGNGDQADPAPYLGYIYRMLQGDAAGMTSFHNDPNDPSAGMNTWAFTGRTVLPGITGNHQYYCGESNTPYQYPEPPLFDPLYQKFRLDRTPSQMQTTWQTAK